MVFRTRVPPGNAGHRDADVTYEKQTFLGTGLVKHRNIGSKHVRSFYGIAGGDETLRHHALSIDVIQDPDVSRCLNNGQHKAIVSK